MNTLPFDYARCQPAKVDAKCNNCKRWFDHPEQENHPYRQPYVAVSDSKDPACHYVPISLQEA